MSEDYDNGFDDGFLTGMAMGDDEDGCYVATSVYGSYDCPEVWTLRRFRDYDLKQNPFGRAFVRFYYATSPTLVKWFGNVQWLKKYLKRLLDHFVHKLKIKGYQDTPYDDPSN